MAEAPFDLKWNVDLRLAPHADRVPPELRRRPVAGNSMVWTGNPEAAQPYLKRALSLCHPDSIRVRELSFLQLQTMADSDFPHGRRYYTKSGYFSYLDETSVDRLVEAVAKIPSEQTQIEFAYLGGAAGQVAANETAFGDRSAPFIMNLLANWANPAEDAANISWVRHLFQTLRPGMKPGVYINFMSGDEQDRVPEVYQERLQRMAMVKAHFDPKNFFRLNQNIAPRSASQASS